MRVLIIEDNISTALDIEIIFNELGDFEITRVASIEESENYFNITLPDLIVADILLDGQSSLGFLKEKASNIPIIILTNNYTNEYYRDSLNLNAVAYLMKPINAVSLKFEVDRILQTKQLRYNGNSDKTMIKDGQKIYMIGSNDIMWIKTEGNYSTIKTTTKKIVVKKSLSKVMAQFDNDILFRTHRSSMIKLNKIDSIDIANSTVIMIDGESIPLSKKQKVLLANQLGEVYKRMI